jgi:hypothetical protein
VNSLQDCDPNWYDRNATMPPWEESRSAYWGWPGKNYRLNNTSPPITWQQCFDRPYSKNRPSRNQPPRGQPQNKGQGWPLGGQPPRGQPQNNGQGWPFGGQPPRGQPQSNGQGWNFGGQPRGGQPQILGQGYQPRGGSQNDDSEDE